MNNKKQLDMIQSLLKVKKIALNYMKGMFDDWQAHRHHFCVYMKKKVVMRLIKIRSKLLKVNLLTNGVNIVKGVKVTGFKRGSNSKAVTGVETDKGIIECEQVVVGAGPWVRDFWNMLELPKVANIKGEDGKIS